MISLCRFKIMVLLVMGLFAAVFSSPDIYALETTQEARPVSISEGINIVLKDSRLLKVALFDKDIVFEDSLIARSALLPQANAFFNQVFLNHQPAAKLGSQVANTAGKQSFSYGLDVYQTLFDFGKSLSNYKAAQEMIVVSREKIEATRKLAVLEFITGYFDLLETQKLIVVAQKEVESLTSYLNDIEHLFEQGAAIKNDLLPARVKLADAKQRLIASRNTEANLSARLNNYLCFPLRQKIIVQDIVLESPKVPEMEDSFKTAQVMRPEIKIIDELFKVSVLNQRAKIAENFPTLYADSGYSYTQNEYQAYQDNLFFNLGAKVNFFDSGAARAGVSVERLRQKQLLEQKNKLSEDIKLEIEDSFFALKNSGEKVLVAKEAVAEAGENVRVNRVKYAEGIATSTDVLEAITLETNAQTNYYTADYELKRSYAKLMYSMGIDLALIYDTMERGKDGLQK